MNKNFTPDTSAALFRALGQPVRLEIILAIGTGEACVCHLEAAIGQRQAYISQQLMVLREAGILESRREGRNIFYQIKDPGVLDLVQTAAKISSQEPGAIKIGGPADLEDECPCPKCGTGKPVTAPDEVIQIGSTSSVQIEDISHD